MSRSYHVNRTHLRGYSKKQLDEMATDPDSVLRQWGRKMFIKETKEKKRKAEKQMSVINRLFGLA